MFYHVKELQYHTKPERQDPSRDNASAEGCWDCGPSMDGLGAFNYVEQPMPFAKKPVLRPAPPYIHDTFPSVLRNGDGLIPPSLK